MGAADPVRLDVSRERESLRTLSLLLQKQKGIRLLDYKDRWLERRLLARVRMTQCSDVGTYVEYVRRNPGEVDRLLDALSINISSFFRDANVYTAIEKTVFESWRKSGELYARKLFRAWSCACAHGEEPYSVSALWENWIQRFSKKPVAELKIIASDVDHGALICGRAAEYDVAAQKDIPPHVSGLFELRGERLFITPHVRRRVHFVHENVLTPTRRRKADLILCRNFQIFLDRNGRQSMMRILQESLLPGGYLVLGRAETLTEPGSRWFSAVDPAHRIYQKKVG